MMEKKFEYTWEEAVTWLKNQPGQHDLVAACYYDDPIEKAALRFYESSEWKAIKQIVPPRSGKSLDVGSGRGMSAYALARDGWDSYALEPNPSSVVGTAAIEKLAQETGVGIKIVRDWGETLPFEDNTFGLIHARQVLHHAKDLRKFCSELYRVLKPGCLVLATREHVLNDDSELAEFLSGHPLHSLYGGEHAYTLLEYMAALKEAGFKLEQNLSPLESPINYSPTTDQKIKAQVWKAAGLSIFGEKLSRFLPMWLIGQLGKHFIKSPGRLHTFVARK